LLEESITIIEQSLNIRNENICPTGKKWRIALNYTEESKREKSLVEITQLNPKTAYTPYGHENDPIFIGKKLPKYPRFYHERFIYLIRHKAAYMSGLNGIVHSNCILYTGTILRHILFLKGKFNTYWYIGSHHVNVDLQTFPTEDHGVSIEEIKVPTASILQHQILNYYHWLLEALPKLLFLRDNLLDSNPEIHVLVPKEGESSIIDQTLKLDVFKGLSKRFIRVSQNLAQTRLYFPKGLYLVDWIHPREDNYGSLGGNVWGVFSPPREAILKVRDFFHEILLIQKPGLISRGDIVFVSRSKTPIRSITNEKEVILSLREEFGDRLKVHSGSESLMEQVEMFYHSKIVVGAHGAGLTNLVFTNPGISVIMIPMDPHVEFCFGNLVAALGSKHYVLTNVPA
jgi:hypothetical protein